MVKIYKNILEEGKTGELKIKTGKTIRDWNYRNKKPALEELIWLITEALSEREK
jgi:hypothetical protein